MRVKAAPLILLQAQEQYSTQAFITVREKTTPYLQMFVEKYNLLTDNSVSLRRTLPGRATYTKELDMTDWSKWTPAAVVVSVT